MRYLWRQFADALTDVLRLIRQGLPSVAIVGSGKDRGVPLAEWDHCASLLESVPLPTDDYAYLKCRIQNGWRYYVEREFGAAAYEMRLALRRARRLRRLYG